MTPLTHKRNISMGETKDAILITLFAILDKGKKHYIVPSVDRLLELLKQYHNINIKRRWFFYCMRHLQDKGYIVTKHRFDHYDDSKIMQLPSMLTYTLKGVSRLMKKRVIGAKRLMKVMLKWMGKDDRRFPKPKEFDNAMSERDIQSNKLRLQELLALIE